MLYMGYFNPGKTHIKNSVTKNDIVPDICSALIKYSDELRKIESLVDIKILLAIGKIAQVPKSVKPPAIKNND